LESVPRDRATKAAIGGLTREGLTYLLSKPEHFCMGR
jgi:hypothetical protein